ncbi:MAG: alpha/beta hydrolase [Dongiaceae bacterium]
MSLETPFTLPTSDGHLINGIVNQASSKKADKLLIMVHGLTGHFKEHIFVAAKDYFNAQGYDVVRFNLYDFPYSGKKFRRFAQTLLKDYISDLNIIIDHFIPSYKKVFYAGHSYGGLTLMLANPKATAMALWDPTFDPNSVQQDLRFIPELDSYKIDWGIEILVSKEFVEENKNFDIKRRQELAAASKAPFRVIEAEEGGYRNSKTYSDYAKVPADKITIPGADHAFTLGDTHRQLCEATENWFNKF